MSPSAGSAETRAFRKATGLTQTVFGQMLGYSLPTVQRWEGLVGPRGKALADLESAALRQSMPSHAAAFRALARAQYVLAERVEYDFREEDTLP